MVHRPSGYGALRRLGGGGGPTGLEPARSYSRAGAVRWPRGGGEEPATGSLGLRGSGVGGKMVRVGGQDMTRK